MTALELTRERITSQKSDAPGDDDRQNWPGWTEAARRALEEQGGE